MARGNPRNARAEVLKALAGGALTAPQAAVAAGLFYTTATTKLRELLAWGDVVIVGTRRSGARGGRPSPIFALANRNA